VKPLRRCSNCGSTEAETAFYPSYKTQCKACLKAKAAPKREATLEYLREWKRANPNAYRDWYEANRERRSEDWRKWYEANKEHRARSYAQWAKANPHIVNAIITRRYAAKRRAVPAWANFEAIRDFYAEAARLTRETGVRHEVDHYYPLQGKLVCGLHCEANLQVITKTENLRKRNRMPEAA
jgi:hypothetical protein